MERKLAEQIVALVNAHIDQLIASLEPVEAEMSAEEFAGYKRGIARVIGAYETEIIDRVTREYPDLKPSDDDHEPPADTHVLPPERVASDHESVDLVNHAFVLFLELYLRIFSRLSARERRALTLAEIEGWCYRDIARELGMAVANVKVLIYRSRRRIWRGMSDALAELGRKVLADSAASS